VLALSYPALAASDGLEHPLGPSRLALHDGATRRVIFQARWLGETAPIDPVSQGATLRIIGAAGEGDSGLVSLEASHWHVKGRTFRYSDRKGAAAGVRSIVLRITRSGGIVRVAGRGAWPYALETPQTQITVTLSIGAARWCARFAGTDVENGRRRVRGHTKSAPESCPCEAPATSTFAAIQTAIFERHGCTQSVCHGSAPGQGGLDLRSEVAYANLVDAPSTILPSQQRVEPGAKEQSLLWRKLAASTLDLQGVPGTAMPNGTFAPLTPNELKAIELWIYNGAPQTGVIKGTDGLLSSCLPPPEPQKIRPPAPPAVGEGAQLYSPPWVIPPHGEGEVCFATYYDFSAQVPAEIQFPCPTIWGGPTKQCFAYKSTALTQDPNSHHSILRLYRGAAAITDPGFGTFTCHGGDHAGMACNPTGTGVAAPDGADCGPRGGCAGSVVPSVACIGFGPADLSYGANLTGADSLNAPQILVSTTPFYRNAYPTGVYNVMPVQGIFVANSHAFNTSDEPTTNEQWLNIYFATAPQRQFLVQDLFDADDIFVQRVPPYQSAEYCRTFTMPAGTRMFELYSHTHARGKLFRGWGPGIATPCTSSIGSCTAETGTPFLVTTDYSDPDTVRFDPPLALDGIAASRRFKYCARYDNGESDPSTVKRQSSSPPMSLAFGSCSTTDLACVGGPHQGEHCQGNNALCDSSPGFGDGLCDACTLRGGVTTDDEMFIMLGSYYCEPGSDCAATLMP
jgi:hypothetical protein